MQVNGRLVSAMKLFLILLAKKNGMGRQGIFLASRATKPIFIKYGSIKII